LLFQFLSQAVRGANVAHRGQRTKPHSLNISALKKEGLKFMTANLKLAVVASDPFDPAALRLDQSFTEGSLAVKKLITTIPVRKPSAQDFIRVHLGADYRLNTAVISLKDDRETYLVAQPLVAELMKECVPVTLFTTMNRQGVLALWPVRLPANDGRTMAW